MIFNSILISETSISYANDTEDLKIEKDNFVEENNLVDKEITSNENEENDFLIKDEETKEDLGHSINKADQTNTEEKDQ